MHDYLREKIFHECLKQTSYLSNVAWFLNYKKASCAEYMHS